MRIRPLLLLLTSLAGPAISACAAFGRSGAVAPEPEGEQPGYETEATDGGVDANPAEGSTHSAGVEEDAVAQALAARKARTQAMVTGVALTSVGAFSALLGGVFLGELRDG